MKLLKLFNNKNICPYCQILLFLIEELYPTGVDKKDTVKTHLKCNNCEERVLFIDSPDQKVVSITCWKYIVTAYSNREHQYSIKKSEKNIIKISAFDIDFSSTTKLKNKLDTYFLLS